jgi:trk system potassium uptake protein TrkH
MDTRPISTDGVFLKLRTGELLVLGFLAVIVVGALLLSLPVSVNDEPVSFIDTLFTATSAVCVTGLVTVDTGAAWSPFGQAVLLILMQIGGLGIMTFSVLMFISIGRLPALRDTWVVEKMFSANPRFGVRKLIKSIFTFTIIMEGIGTAVMFAGWTRYGYGPGKSLWYAAFHSVSAFCNAGFAFFGDSLESFSGDWLLVMTFAILIITGGIGFYVVLDLWEWVRRRGAHRLSLHTRLVLWTTLVLLVLGSALLFFGEYVTAASGPTTMHKLLNAFFQSVTSRTAGFNTVSITSLSNVSLLTIIMLMFIGSSPGSCGGGVRTTSLALLAALVVNRLRGNTEVNIEGRTIPEQTVHRMVSVIVIGVLLVVLSTLLLLLTQAQEFAHPHDRGLFIEYLFESVSALGTVGLSMGVTSGLNLQGKLIIIVMMFVGRVGLVTLAYSVLRPKKRVQLCYSTEDVML